jgi:VWFA-related protein
VIAGAATLAARPQANPSAASTTTAVIYVAALDAHRVPIADLSPPDFAVVEDGVERQVISAEVARGAMQIAIIVDDNGSGLFRYGLLAFAERVQGRAEIALFVVTGQVKKLFDFTTDVRLWSAGIATLGVRPPTPEGGQVLEAVSDAARALRRREAGRSAIIVLTVGGEEHSTLRARDVLNQLHDSRALFYVLSAASATIRPTRKVDKPAELLDSNLERNHVLGDGPAQSGGQRRDVIATSALLTDVQEIARDLLSRYAVTYVRPAGGRTPQKLVVSVRRPDVRVIAPTRAPAR